jgi:hypothetical protein
MILQHWLKYRRIIDIILVKNNVEENENQPFFFFGGKWTLEDNGQWRI